MNIRTDNKKVVRHDPLKGGRIEKYSGLIIVVVETMIHAQVVHHCF